MINALHPTIHASAASGAATTTPPSAAASTSNAAVGTGGSVSASGGVSLGNTDFLTLMLAQLQNQDPTSPVDSNTFLTQLAQLSEVQGISSLNSNFATLSSSLISNQAMQASSLLGHQALVPSSTTTLTSAGGTVTGAIAVPQTSSDVVLAIKNSGGQIVQQIDLGAQAAGITNFSWNGTLANNSAAPAGTYTLSAQVAGVSAGTTVSTYVNGLIQSVTMGAGSTGMILNVAGQGAVPFSSVEEISN